MNYYIGADLGTSGLKLLLVDAKGKILNSVTKNYQVYYPNPGWSEQNPEDWWNAFVSGVGELLSGFDAKSVKGLSVAGQMHALVILDQNDEVIRPAILWNDGRTDRETEYLNTIVGKQKLSDYTANIAFAGFTAPKILWLKNNEKENFNKISKIMLPKDYIAYRLTGVHSIDYSDASGTLLLDVKNKCWSKEMLKICDVREEQLPKLYESFDYTGEVLPENAKLLGFADGVRVAAGAGDNAGAAIGTATVGEGKCNISLGTSGTIFISSEKFGVDKFNALHSFCHSDGGYHLMGCILSAASCNKWFYEEILKTDDYSGEQAGIREQNLGKNHVYFLPYLMGERSPINDTDARGLFVGMRPDTTRQDMILAVLEGVAFAFRDNLEIAKSLGVDVKVSTICGGGAKSKLWQKIIANILNIELEIPAVEEGPGLGAAMLAMVACGEYDSVLTCAKTLVLKKETIRPHAETVARYEESYQKYRKIYPAIKQLYKELI
ncbi:MAG: xylulokinase [Ruminococcaceae bacterium]|nr:xylulokinase [Oscillospiraceae bacterium]